MTPNEQKYLTAILKAICILKQPVVEDDWYTVKEALAVLQKACGILDLTEFNANLLTVSKKVRDELSWVLTNSPTCNELYKELCLAIEIAEAQLDKKD